MLLAITSDVSGSRGGGGCRLGRPLLPHSFYNLQVVTRFEQREYEWVEQWKSAAEALADRRRRDLRRMSEDEALAAAENLLSLVDTVALNPARRSSSGLVEQQAILHRRSRA